MTEQQAAQWLKAGDNYLLLTHVRPDGDTLGSAAALAKALRLLGRQAYLAPNFGVTATFDGYLDDVFAPEDFVPEHIVSVDLAAVQLIPPEMKRWEKQVELSIDHHPSNEGYAKETCLDSTAAATGEIIYRICKELGVMDEEIAARLYLAISTDCGCFVYSNTTPETHRIAAELMGVGDFWKKINKRMFQTLSLTEIRLQNRLMSSMEMYDEGATVLCSISLADVEELKATPADTEALSSFAIQIEGVKTAATLKQLEEKVWKVSLRTDCTVNATKVCSLLGGGGHAAAAGASMSGVNEAEARAMVLGAIRKVQAEG